MSAVRGRLVPWHSWQEWEAVVAPLAIGDGERYAWALRRARVWRSRGRLPAALEFLLAMREARDDAAAGASEYAERCMIAMSIVRLVNGVTGAAQQRGVSVSGLAGAAKLPALCVEVRHAATHNALPPAAQLRAAAALALQWVHDAYVEQQRSTTRGKEMELGNAWLELMRATRDEARCAAKLAEDGDDADAAGAAASSRKRRRAAVTSLASLVIAGYERDAARVALDAWQGGLWTQPHESGNEAGGAGMSKKERKRRRREAETGGCSEDDARFDVLRVSLRRMGQKLGAHFRAEVARAAIERFVVVAGGEYDSAHVTRVTGVVARACGDDVVASAAAAAHDELLDNEEGPDSVHVHALRSIMSMRDAVNVDGSRTTTKSNDEYESDDDDDGDGADDDVDVNGGEDDACARTSVARVDSEAASAPTRTGASTVQARASGATDSARAAARGWTLCESWTPRPIGFVVGDSFLGRDDVAPSVPTLPRPSTTLPRPEPAPDLPGVRDGGTPGTGDYSAQWRPISSVTDAEYLDIGIL